MLLVRYALICGVCGGLSELIFSILSPLPFFNKGIYYFLIPSISFTIFGLGLGYSINLILDKRGYLKRLIVGGIIGGSLFGLFVPLFTFIYMGFLPLTVSLVISLGKMKNKFRVILGGLAGTIVGAIVGALLIMSVANSSIFGNGLIKAILGIVALTTFISYGILSSIQTLTLPEKSI